MIRVSIRVCLLIAVGAALTVTLVSGQTEAKEPQWKGQAEYQMYSAVMNEKDPHRKLAALDQWKEKYPQTDFRVQRLALYLSVYQQLNDAPKLIGTLNTMLELNPQDLQVMNGIMFYAMQSDKPAAGDLELAQRVAQSALANLDVKPAGVTDAQWPAFRKGVEALAHATMGWVAMNRKDASGAEDAFSKALQIDPNMSKVDLMLATALWGTKTPPNIAKALFYYARAAAYDGEGSPLELPARRQLDDFLRKAYKTYHGSEEGLDDLKKLARSQPFPPDGFTILSEAQLEAQKQKELAERDPQLALWMNLKQTLTGPKGAEFFESNMKGADVPGGAGGVQGFKATVISATPAARTKSLVVAISDSKTPEVTLNLDAPVVGRVETGCQIEFSGVPTEFSAEPFHVTFAVEKARIKGLKVEKPVVRHHAAAH